MYGYEQVIIASAVTPLFVALILVLATPIIETRRAKRLARGRIGVTGLRLYWDYPAWQMKLAKSFLRDAVVALLMISFFAPMFVTFLFTLQAMIISFL